MSVFIIFHFYQFREQNLGDVLDINNVEKVYFFENPKENSDFNTHIIEVISHTIEDEETINKLAEFFKQYQIKASKQEGWVSENASEQFHFSFVYNDGDSAPYIFDRNIVVSSNIYKVVNDPIDYKWLYELMQDIKSN